MVPTSSSQTVTTNQQTTHQTLIPKLLMISFSLMMSSSDAFSSTRTTQQQQMRSWGQIRTSNYGSTSLKYIIEDNIFEERKIQEGIHDIKKKQMEKRMTRGVKYDLGVGKNKPVVVVVGCDGEDGNIERKVNEESGEVAKFWMVPEPVIKPFVDVNFDQSYEEKSKSSSRVTNDVLKQHQQQIENKEDSIKRKKKKELSQPTLNNVKWSFDGKKGDEVVISERVGMEDLVYGRKGKFDMNTLWVELLIHESL